MIFNRDVSKVLAAVVGRSIIARRWMATALPLARHLDSRLGGGLA